MCEVDLMRTELDLREMQLRMKEEGEGMKCKLKEGGKWMEERQMSACSRDFPQSTSL